ncbi:MAG: dTDP-4-dehydrorhamnose reductase [Rhodothermaceae bacterium]|nr:dTDP-4-dehydrorhamnose reductase [Rhodothermaceae bacterium]
MTWLVTGANGQVGHALVQAAPSEVIGLDRAALDITDAEAVRRAIAARAPDAVINAAAYTAVDRAEAEPEIAFAVNRDGAANLADACAAVGIPLLHISTDYVFDGTKAAPYTEDDAPNPLGVYGQSKWEGEEAIRDRFDQHIILRTAWVFGAHGTNFVQTILRLAREREALRIVADQHGHPTPAAAIAEALLHIARGVCAQQGQWGTYHFAGQPPTTWHGFAKAIVAEARAHEPLAVQTLEPIDTTAYPTPALRPLSTLLDTTRISEAFGLTMPDWREELRRIVVEG